MKRFAIIACLLILPGPARADEPKELAHNAALRYWQAIAVMPDAKSESHKLIEEFDRADLAKARELVDSAGDALRMMHRGAAIGPVAWGFDYEQDGPQPCSPTSAASATSPESP